MVGIACRRKCKQRPSYAARAPSLIAILLSTVRVPPRSTPRPRRPSRRRRPRPSSSALWPQRRRASHPRRNTTRGIIRVAVSLERLHARARAGWHGGHAVALPFSGLDGREERLVPIGIEFYGRDAAGDTPPITTPPSSLRRTARSKPRADFCTSLVQREFIRVHVGRGDEHPSVAAVLLLVPQRTEDESAEGEKECTAERGEGDFESLARRLKAIDLRCHRLGVSSRGACTGRGNSDADGNGRRRRRGGARGFPRRQRRGCAFAIRELAQRGREPGQKSRSRGFAS